MKSMFCSSAGPALLSTLLLFALGSTSAFAQSGSSGGSIGNDDKSLSGTRTAPRAATPSKPERSKNSEAPRRATRKGGSESSGGGGNFDGSWVVVAEGSPCGSSTERLVISGGSISGEMSSGQVSPNGATTGGGSAGGLTWTSSGRFSGRSGSGSFVRSDGCRGHWTASKR